jgi:hypothetical protein
VFSDESTYSSANDGLVLVYRLQGQCYSCQYISTSTHTYVISVFTFGAVCPMKELECCIIYKVTWAVYGISTFLKT